MSNNEIITKFEPKNDNMLNILHALQNNNPTHHLTSEDLKLIAKYLNTTYSSVYGVAKYYSMFSLKPRGKYVVRVCQSPLCQMMSKDSLLQEIEKNIGIGLNETTKDQLFSVESSECLGHCSEAPVIMINDQVYKNLDSIKIKQVFQHIQKNEQKKA